MRKLLFAVMLASLPLAALANGPVGVWSHPAGDRIDLFDDQGKCPVGTKRAAYFIAANGETVGGCWGTARTILICMMFDDGDQGCLPSKDFKWQPGMAPAKLTRWM